MKHKKHLLILALVASLTTNSAQALLIDRGNGLLYDNVLNVTWLQDANYAKTSGYSATGLMDWASANTWADNLIFDGLTGWRLAANTPINGSSFIYNYSSFDGTTDTGSNITSPKNELAYMYYVNLGLKSRYNPTTGADQSDWGIYGNGAFYGQNTVGLVNNLQSYVYWLQTESNDENNLPYSYPFGAFAFQFTDGYTGAAAKYHPLYAWAVRPGDVVAVPEPATFWLFSIGLMSLLSLLSLRRRAVMSGN